MGKHQATTVLHPCLFMTFAALLGNKLTAKMGTSCHPTFFSTIITDDNDTLIKKKFTQQRAPFSHFTLHFSKRAYPSKRYLHAQGYTSESERNEKHGTAQFNARLVVLKFRKQQMFHEGRFSCACVAHSICMHS
jgi:hypothetical protein